MHSKWIRPYGMFVALALFALPVAACAQGHHHERSHRAQISVTNDTDVQVQLRIWAENLDGGVQSWTFKPGQNTWLGAGNNIRLMVHGDDMIQIADWEKVPIRDVADFREGAWYLSVRAARRATHRR